VVKRSAREARVRGALFGTASPPAVAFVLLASGCLPSYGDAILAGSAPAPIHLVGDQLAPQPLVVAGGYVYFINNDPSLGSVLRVPAGGGPAETLSDGLDVDALVFAVDESNVYFPSRTGVMAVPVQGGTATLLAASMTRAVLAEGPSVYFCEQLADGQGGLAVKEVPKAGGASTELATLPGFDPVTGFALAAGQLYVAGTLEQAVARIAIAGGPPVFLDVNGGSIASDGTTLFFSMPAQGSIGAVPVAGGAPASLAANLLSPDALAVDDSHVYFSVAGEPPWVARVPKGGGGGVERLAPTHAQPRATAVDAQAVYWTDSADGIVAELMK
jgi:hypothetical protein